MKKIIVFFTLAIIANSACAQWTNNYGTCISYGQRNLSIAQINGADTAVFDMKLFNLGFNVFFYTKYHLGVEQQNNNKNNKRRRNTDENKPYTLSLGGPIGLGLNAGGSSINGFGLQYFYTAAPGLDINFLNSKPNSNDNFGFFAGVGLAITGANSYSGSFTQVNKPYTSGMVSRASIVEFKPSSIVVGPELRAGIDIGKGMGGSSSAFHLHVRYQPSLFKTGLNYYHIGFFMPFLNGGRNGW